MTTQVLHATLYQHLLNLPGVEPLPPAYQTARGQVPRNSTQEFARQGTFFAGLRSKGQRVLLYLSPSLKRRLHTPAYQSLLVRYQRGQAGACLVLAASLPAEALGAVLVLLTAGTGAEGD